MKGIVLYFIVILVGAHSLANAAENPCIVLNTRYVLEDSVFIDTCSARLVNLNRSRYEVTFRWYVIHSPVILRDTSLYFGWEEVDSTYKDLRADLKSLQTRVGHFALIKTDPYIEDTGSVLNKIFTFRFDSLMNVDTALSLLNALPSVANVVWRARLDTRSVEEAHQPSIHVWPQPCTSSTFKLEVDSDRDVSFFDVLGRKIELPMERQSNEVTVDVSTLTTSVLYCVVQGSVLKIVMMR